MCSRRLVVAAPSKRALADELGATLLWPHLFLRCLVLVSSDFFALHLSYHRPDFRFCPLSSVLRSRTLFRICSLCALPSLVLPAVLGRPPAFAVRGTTVVALTKTFLLCLSVALLPTLYCKSSVDLPRPDGMSALP